MWSVVVCCVTSNSVLSIDRSSSFSMYRNCWFSGNVTIVEQLQFVDDKITLISTLLDSPFHIVTVVLRFEYVVLSCNRCFIICCPSSIIPKQNRAPLTVGSFGSSHSLYRIFMRPEPPERAIALATGNPCSSTSVVHEIHLIPALIPCYANICVDEGRRGG